MDACIIKTGTKIEIEYDEKNKRERSLIKRSWIFGNGAEDEVDFKLGLNEGCAPKHFLIEYNEKRNTYHLTNLKEGTNVSVKLNWILVYYLLIIEYKVTYHYIFR